MIQETAQDRVASAAAWLLLGVAGGLVLDLCAKHLLATYPLTEFIFFRSVVGVVLLLILTPRFFGGFASLKTKQWKWHLLRTLLAIGAMFGFFYGLARMPLVNALTLGYTAPLMVTALSVPCLGERVGWRRWVAVCGGFAGVLLMLRPGSQGFDFASVAVLLAAFCYASQAIIARHLANSESILSMSLYVVIGPMLVAALPLGDSRWIVPDMQGWLLLMTAAMGSIVAWIGFIKGYRGASPAVLAPLEYTALVGGAIAGYLIWNEIPDRLVVAGAAIVVTSGIVVVCREVRSTSGLR